MQTSIRKSGSNAYVLTLGESEIALDHRTLKELLLEITKILLSQETTGAEDEALELAAMIKAEDDIGVQKFILAAEHEDVLILLKSLKDDKAFHEKIYGNMSEKARTLFTEDAEFKRADLLSKSEIGNAVGRLKLVLKKLKD